MFKNLSDMMKDIDKEYEISRKKEGVKGWKGTVNVEDAVQKFFDSLP